MASEYLFKSESKQWSPINTERKLAVVKMFRTAWCRRTSILRVKNSYIGVDEFPIP